MKLEIHPLSNPFTGEVAKYIEVFDPRVVPSRPAIEAVPADPSRNFPGNPEVPAFLGSISCIAQYYDEQNNHIPRSAIRNDKTALTPEQYAAWTDAVIDDDTYFTNCVIANLGLTKV